MLNTNKDKIQNKTNALAEEAKNGVNKASRELKSSADKANGAVDKTTNQAEDKAEALINGLRDLINDHSDITKENTMKAQIIERASELKHVVGEEISHAYDVSKERAIESVKNHPAATLALVAGTGLLLGYVLGSKQSSN
jgi:ElaB/YqjD/DUF883 family membrane-anchored ribosome-binding protein